MKIVCNKLFSRFSMKNGRRQRFFLNNIKTYDPHKRKLEMEFVAYVNNELLTYEFWH